MMAARSGEMIQKLHFSISYFVKSTILMWFFLDRISWLNLSQKSARRDIFWFAHLKCSCNSGKTLHTLSTNFGVCSTNVPIMHTLLGYTQPKATCHFCFCLCNVCECMCLVSALIYGIASSCLLIIGRLTVAVVVVAFCAIILLIFCLYLGRFLLGELPSPSCVHCVCVRAVVFVVQNKQKKHFFFSCTAWRTSVSFDQGSRTRSIYRQLMCVCVLVQYKLSW